MAVLPEKQASRQVAQIAKQAAKEIKKAAAAQRKEARQLAITRAGKRDRLGSVVVCKLRIMGWGGGAPGVGASVRPASGQDGTRQEEARRSGYQGEGLGVNHIDQYFSSIPEKQCVWLGLCRQRDMREKGRLLT